MREISPQEKEIMQIVWNSGDDYLTAREIETALQAKDGKARNIASLMSVLAKLADKSFLDPVKKFRKSTIFVPLIGETEYKVFATKQFMDGTHGGEFASLASALVNNAEYSKKDIERLWRLLKQKS